MKDIEDALIQNLTYHSDQWDFRQESDVVANHAVMRCRNRTLDILVKLDLLGPYSEVATTPATCEDINLTMAFTAPFSRLAIAHMRSRLNNENEAKREAKATELRKKLSLVTPPTQ